MNGKLIQVLDQLEIPVFWNHFSGNGKTYIVFNEFLNQGKEFAEDKEISTERHYQINVYSKGDYTNIVKKAERLLKENGFMKRSQFDAPYNKDTGYFQKVLRYMYVEEI